MIIYNGQTELIEGDGIKEFALIADKAALLFADNGWTWGGDTLPPDTHAIRHQLGSLMISAVNQARDDQRGWGKFSSGRLYASASRCEDVFNNVTQYVIGLGIEFPL